MELLLEEERRLGEGSSDAIDRQRSTIMSKEEMERVDWFLQHIETRESEIQAEIAEEWDEIDELYAGDRQQAGEGEAYRSSVNVLLPTVEGQVSAIVNKRIEAKFRGVGPSDKPFERMAEIVTRTLLRYNKVRRRTKQAARNYLLYGNMTLYAAWDADAMDGWGAPVLEVMGPGEVIVDGKIKSIDDIDDADFVAVKKGNRSLSWLLLQEEAGITREGAHAIIDKGLRESQSEDKKTDDDDSFELIEVWTKLNDTQSLERLWITRDGLLLTASDDGKDESGATDGEEEKGAPYYQLVGNRYPVFPATCYPRRGKYYGFGDGLLLKPVQKLLNNLYDEVIKACKYSAHGTDYIDPAASIDPDDIVAIDPDRPRIAIDPKNNILHVPGGGINQVVFVMIENLFERVNLMTRFSPLMTGNRPGEQMTATQAGIQQQQGATGVDDKKADMSEAFCDAVLYMLGLCMEMWPAAKAFRISEEEEDYEWVDLRIMKNIPVLIPVTRAYKERFRRMNPGDEAPRFMQLYNEEDELDEEGNPILEWDPRDQRDFEGLSDEQRSKFMPSYAPIAKTKRVEATKRVDFDVTVSLGEGLPASSVALYNIILSLAQLQIPDERTGTIRPLIGFKQVRQIIEDTIGIHIDDENEDEMLGQMRAQLTAQGGGQQQQPINNHESIPGANLAGQQKGMMTRGTNI